MLCGERHSDAGSQSGIQNGVKRGILRRIRTITGSTVKRALPVAIALALLPVASVPVFAQSCTTQAALQPALRDTLAGAAHTLGTAVKAGDIAALKAITIPEYANNFAPTEYLVRTTSEKLAGNNLSVTQLYVLDATTRKAGDTSEADFSCPLKGTTSEVDFSIAALPPGRYAFAMVEATGGAHPWLLSFLLQDAGGWKMAGFYPHARSAAGHDGLWYWTAAREHARTKQSWLAWLYFRQADELLSPASFVTSTLLDKLHSEQRIAAPPELADMPEGPSTTTPLVLKAANDVEFRFTSLSSESAPDDKSLHLVLHYAADANATAEALHTHGEAVAKALIDAHPELRQGYSAVLVFGDIPQQNPVVLSLDMDKIP
jgi:hypothetical protein